MTTLKAALKEVCYLELEDIPSEEVLSADGTLTFSATFERRMKKLIRRADHPIRYRVTQAVACLLLAALLSGCTVLAISPEARGAFVGWVREVSEGWFVYHYTGETQDSPKDVVYCPAWVPDGYKLITEPEVGPQQTAIYENPEGDQINFICIINTESAALYIEDKGDQSLDVYVGNILANLYLDPHEGNPNALVWEDGDKGFFFWIHAPLTGEELIKIAESVEAQEIGDTAEMTP